MKRFQVIDDPDLNLTAQEKRAAFMVCARPDAWVQKAIEWRHAAEVLLSQNEIDERERVIARFASKTSRTLDHVPPNISAEGLFCAAVAAENYLKAAVVAKNPSWVSKGKLERYQIGTHFLEALAQRAGIALDAAEESFCLVATQALDDWGKYPVPMRVDRGSGEWAMFVTSRDNIMTVLKSLSDKSAQAITSAGDQFERCLREVAREET